MRFISKTRLLASSMLVSASVFGLAIAANAQEATFVVSAQNVGTPSYNPINGTRLNDAITLIFDRMVIQDADQTFHGQLATEWESTADGMSWTFKLRNTKLGGDDVERDGTNLHRTLDHHLSGSGHRDNGHLDKPFW